jgi:hypothetical protein
MNICYPHYYCTCGRFNRKCHYCRKKETFYRRHYICLDCCIGWKSKYEINLKPTVDAAQLQEYRKIDDPIINYKGPRCTKCSKDADEVGRDFKVPKQSDKKAWKELQELKIFYEKTEIYGFSFYMVKKYTYNCGHEHGESLYEKRIK